MTCFEQVPKVFKEKEFAERKTVPIPLEQGGGISE